MKPTPLPSKLSALILVALNDLEAVENDPRYKVNMASWHVPNGQCAVCLAGAVMAKSLKVPINEDWLPSNTDYWKELRALDEIREGNIRNALGCLGEVLDEIEPFAPVTDYHNNPDMFKLELTLLARALEEIGL